MHVVTSRSRSMNSFTVSGVIVDSGTVGSGGVVASTADGGVAHTNSETSAQTIVDTSGFVRFDMVPSSHPAEPVTQSAPPTTM